MNKNLAAVLSVFIIVIFICYIIFDSTKLSESSTTDPEALKEEKLPDSWEISGEIGIKTGILKAVTVASSGNIYVGGDSFVSCFNSDLTPEWSITTPYPVTSLSCYGDTIFASSMELIMVIGKEGMIKDEWGPFEDNAIITSVSSNRSAVAFADAGNRIIFILDKSGMVKKLIGENDGQFIVPSPYFDVALDMDNNLYVANTGHRRIETRTIDGEIKSFFGEPGTSPQAFSGCCNPAHFIKIPDGFVTAEKGINRIKILNNKGEFKEYVSSENKFQASVPLDLASADGKLIYAANPADSKVYIYTRKSEQ